MLGELTRLLNLTGDELENIKIRPQHIVELLDLIDAGTLSTGMAKSVFEEMYNTGSTPKRIAQRSGMVQMSDADAVRPAVEEAIAGNPKAVDDFLNGRGSAIRFLVGQVMRITRGKANPQLASRLVQEKLESMR